jgi:hypothetical protein
MDFPSHIGYRYEHYNNFYKFCVLLFDLRIQFSITAIATQNTTAVVQTTIGTL